MKYRVQVVIEEELLGKTVAALSQLGLTLSVKAVAQGVTEVHYEEAPRPAPESKPDPEPESKPEPEPKSEPDGPLVLAYHPVRVRSTRELPPTKALPPTSRYAGRGKANPKTGPQEALVRPINDMIIETVAAQPGQSAAEIAAAIGMDGSEDKQGVSARLGQLFRKGLLKRENVGPYETRTVFRYYPNDTDNPKALTYEEEKHAIAQDLAQDLAPVDGKE
jgi:hypothetical protein